MRLLIRQIAAKDRNELEALFTSCDVPTVTRYFHPFPLDTDSAYRVAVEPGRDRFYGAWAGGELVGFTMLRGWNDGFSIPSFGVVVHPEFQGSGIGRALTSFAIDEAERLGCPALRLSVYASNERSYSLYQKFGFVEQERTWIEVNGHIDARIVMMKKLKNSGVRD